MPLPNPPPKRGRLSPRREGLNNYTLFSPGRRATIDFICPVLSPPWGVWGLKPEEKKKIISFAHNFYQKL